jgi:hypothetical protein
VGGADGLRLSARHQPWPAVLAQRLQQPVPRAPRVGRGARLGGGQEEDQGLLHQPGQQLDHRGRLDLPTGAHGLGGVQREAPREDRQPIEEDPLLVGQEVVAPVDRRLQGLLAGQRGAAAPRQHPEPVLEAGEELLHRQHPDAGRGQLEGQRDAVQPHAHLRDGGGVPGGQAEPGERRPGPVGEQAHGLRPGDLRDRGPRLRVRTAGERRERQRRHAPHRLTREPQRLAAGRQDADVRAGAQQRLGQRGAGADEVLAVVEHEQEALGPQRVAERGQQGAAGLLAHADDGRHRLGDGGRVGERGELDQPDAAGEPLPREQGLRHPEGQPRLAGAAGAGERDQAPGAQQPGRLGHVALPPDEAGERRREVVRRVGRAGALGGRLGGGPERGAVLRSQA